MSAFTTILRGIVGSTAYGLDRPGSDVDRLGLYVAPTVQFHGLHPPKQTHVLTEPSDHTEHEAGKYISLLLSCNPTVTELLWLPDELYEIKRGAGVELIGIRRTFLSAKGVRNAYLGYATQQFKRLSERGDGSFSSDTRKRTEKHARHLRRLCWQGYTLYSTGVLPIRVEDPDSYFRFGELVARDARAAQEVIELYEELFDSGASVLPDRPDESLAEEWLRDIRAVDYGRDLPRRDLEGRAITRYGDRVDTLRSQLSGWHFSKESLTAEELKMLYVGEQLMGELDRIAGGYYQ